MRALLYLLLLMMAGHAADTPEQAALDFAEGLREGLDKEQLTKLCSLNPDTGDKKKDLIQEGWRSAAKKMLRIPFHVADKKIDGDEAAVVLRQFDPEIGKQAHVVSFAIVKRDQTWLAAPIISSFQNSVVTYDDALLEKRRSLEHWMLGREISVREETRQKADSYMLEMMQKSIPADKLKSVTPEELLRDLIQACQQRNQAGVLARLGGYSTDHVAGWGAISRKIPDVFTSAALTAWPWNLLSDSRTLAVMGEPLDLGDEHTIDMIFLHPQSIDDTPQQLTFTMRRDEQGLMHLELPDIFLANSADEEEDAYLVDLEEADGLTLYEKLREKARAFLPDTDFAKSESLAEVIEKSLKSYHFSSFWGATARPGDKVRNSGMPSILSLWQRLQGKNSTSLLRKVGFMEKDDQALLVMQAYAPQGMDSAKLQKIWLTRELGQWQMTGETPDEPLQELDKWFTENSEKWNKNWTLDLLVDAVLLNEGAALERQPLDTEKIRAAFAQWTQALKEKSMAKIVAQCATFDDKASITRTLRNLSGEILYGSGRMEILGINVSGSWGGVSVRQISEMPNATPEYPLFVFVGTEKGPRLLSQVDLKLTTVGNRSREFLNEIAFKDLSKRLPAAAISELRSIYEKHSNLVHQKDVIKQ